MEKEKPKIIIEAEKRPLRAEESIESRKELETEYSPFKTPAKMKELIDNEIEAFTQPRLGRLEKIFEKVNKHFPQIKEDNTSYSDCISFFFRTKIGRKIIHETAELFFDIMLEDGIGTIKKDKELEMLFSLFLRPPLVLSKYKKEEISEQVKEKIAKCAMRYKKIGDIERAERILINFQKSCRNLHHIIFKDTVFSEELSIVRNNLTDFVINSWAYILSNYSSALFGKDVTKI